VSRLNSLIHYFEVELPFPEKIAALKIQETVTILRTIDPEIEVVLVNFE
jgi:hypothetical protein